MIESLYDQINLKEGEPPVPSELVWTAAGVPDYNIVKMNGSIFAFGKWRSYDNITVPIPSLSLGTYIFSCWVNDTYGNEAISNITVVVYQIGSEYYNEHELVFNLNSIASGGYITATVGGKVVGGLSEGGTSISQGEVKVGFKKPGKYYRKTHFWMYMAALLTGVVFSISLIYIMYPIVLNSSFLVIFSTILGPIGFYFGTYAFIYIGLYKYKGNLWEAYYKGKKKFFWDVFKWIKIPSLCFSIYGTYSMFMILTFNNVTSVLLIFIIMLISMIILLTISIFTIGKKIDKEDLKNKMLKSLSNNKKSK